MRNPQTNEQLFRRIENTIKINEHLCWITTYHKDKDGYQFISYQKTPTLKTTKRTHRITYEHYFGPIRKNLQIDHLCRNRACCNPHHLQAVTCKTNIQRGNTGKWCTPERMRQLSINYWNKQPKNGKARTEAAQRLLQHRYNWKLRKAAITSETQSEDVFRHSDGHHRNHETDRNHAIHQNDRA